MKTSSIYICALLLLLTFSSTVFADVEYPYQVVDGKVAFKKYSNSDQVFLEKATSAAFEVLYKGDDFSVARSNKHYYCDGNLLPADFDIKVASSNGPFLFSGSVSQSYCKDTEEKINPEHFKALAFPFFKDDKFVYTVSGRVVKKADPKTVKTARNQAFDDKNYYFIAGDTITIPYSASAAFYEGCYAWANVDNKIYYEGVLNTEIDADSFQCQGFESFTVIDKQGFYTSGTRSLSFSSPVDTSKVKTLQGNFISDGKSLWYIGVAPMMLAGIDAKNSSIVGNEVSDGKTTWVCSSSQRNNDPMCKRADKPSEKLMAELNKLK